MKIDWLESFLNDKDEIVYSLDKIPVAYEIREITNGWVVLNWHDETWLKFAVLEFNHSDGDGSNTVTTPVFHGEGPSGSLRECRHTYWGYDGYIFYPNGQLITEAFKVLSEFYDLD